MRALSVSTRLCLTTCEVPRAFSGRLAITLFRHAASEPYPTRTVEHMLAWMIVIWSLAVAWPGKMLVGPQYEYLIVIMPEWAWGWTGVVLGTGRLLALYFNGNWRRSPGLRWFGAMTGLVWWTVLSGLYWLGVQAGGADFPMRYMVGVFIFFEGYSCYRCGQDMAPSKAQSAGASGLTIGTGNG